MKVALYARVSMEEDDVNNRRFQNPNNQLDPLRSWATEKGWEITHIYQDRGSGADPSRIQFREMLADAMQRKFNAILVWKFDRFTRESMSISLGYVEKLKGRGVGVKSLTESWLDTTSENPIGDVILAIMSWAAAEERRKISERTKAGIARRRAIGQWHGGRPRKERGVAVTAEKRMLSKETFLLPKFKEVS